MAFSSPLGAPSVAVGVVLTAFGDHKKRPEAVIIAYFEGEQLAKVILVLLFERPNAFAFAFLETFPAPPKWLLPAARAWGGPPGGT